jgi:xylulokinase
MRAAAVLEICVALPCFIGIDVGTTSVKAILIEAGGRVLDSFAAPHPTRRPRPGHVEQDPADWMARVLGALDRFAHSGHCTHIRGIGICSQVNTHVFVDDAGSPLLPAITWQDGRCAAVAHELDAQISTQQKLDWFGGPLPIDASNALSRMAYVARHHPEIFALTRYVLLPKDYCIHALTGVFVADPIAAIGLTDKRLGYIPEQLDLVPGAAQRVAPLFDFTHVAGRIRPGLPCAGLPIVVGAMDAWAGMFGVGVVADGDAMYQSGTSEIPGIVSSTIVPTPGVVLFPAYHGITLHAAPTQSGGAALAWVGRLLGKSAEELSALAASVEPGAAIPLFLPHLEGERAPLWDSASRSVFARLEAGTGPAELARSVMEGVALAARLAFDALESSAGRSVETVHIGGGGARSDVWCQIRADVLDKRLRRVAVAEAGALGAAILGGLGSSEMVSLRDSIEALVRFDRYFEPDNRIRHHYDFILLRYSQIYFDLRSFNSSFH